MTTTLYISHPERWWRASRTDLPWLTDPHEADRKVRHHDRDERQWHAIASTVETVARAIAHGAHDVDQDDTTVAVIHLELDHLHPPDRQIVTSWFRATAEAPSGDPWDTRLNNGRHRLWSTWQAAPNAILPLYSTLLAGLDEVPYMGDDDVLLMLDDVAAGLSDMPPGPAKRSPRYIEELRRVARGGGDL